MGTKKIYSVLSGLVAFISGIMLWMYYSQEISVAFGRNTSRYGTVNGIFNFIFTAEMGEIISIILLFFLGVQLILAKRERLFSAAVILQVFVLFYLSYYLSTTQVMRLSLFTYLIIIYTFLLSLIYRKYNKNIKPIHPTNLVLSKIVWGFFYIIYLVFVHIYIYNMEREVNMHCLFWGIWFMIFYSILWILIILFISSPEKTAGAEAEANQQLSQPVSNNIQTQECGGLNQPNTNGRNQQPNALDSNNSVSQHKKDNETQENKTQYKPLKQCPVCFSTVSDNALFCEICGSKLK